MSRKRSAEDGGGTEFYKKSTWDNLDRYAHKSDRLNDRTGVSQNFISAPERPKTKAPRIGPAVQDRDGEADGSVLAGGLAVGAGTALAATLGGAGYAYRDDIADAAKRARASNDRTRIRDRVRSVTEQIRSTLRRQGTGRSGLSEPLISPKPVDAHNIEEHIGPENRPQKRLNQADDIVVRTEMLPKSNPGRGDGERLRNMRNRRVGAGEGPQAQRMKAYEEFLREMPTVEELQAINSRLPPERIAKIHEAYVKAVNSGQIQSGHAKNIADLKQKIADYKPTAEALQEEAQRIRNLTPSQKAEMTRTQAAVGQKVVKNDDIRQRKGARAAAVKDALNKADDFRRPTRADIRKGMAKGARGVAPMLGTMVGESVADALIGDDDDGNLSAMEMAEHHGMKATAGGAGAGLFAAAAGVGGVAATAAGAGIGVGLLASEGVGAAMDETDAFGQGETQIISSGVGMGVGGATTEVVATLAAGSALDAAAIGAAGVGAGLAAAGFASVAYVANEYEADHGRADHVELYKGHAEARKAGHGQGAQSHVAAGSVGLGKEADAQLYKTVEAVAEPTSAAIRGAGSAIETATAPIGKALGIGG